MLIDQLTLFHLIHSLFIHNIICTWADDRRTKSLIAIIKWQALDHRRSDDSSPDLVPPDHVVRLLSTRLSERCQTSCWWSPTFTRWTFHQIEFNPQKCSKFTKKSPIVKIVNQKFCSAAISSWEGGDADTLRAKQGLNVTNLVKAQNLPSKYKSTFYIDFVESFSCSWRQLFPLALKRASATETSDFSPGCPSHPPSILFCKPIGCQVTIFEHLIFIFAIWLSLSSADQEAMTQNRDWKPSR